MTSHEVFPFDEYDQPTVQPELLGYQAEKLTFTPEGFTYQPVKTDEEIAAEEDPTDDEILDRLEQDADPAPVERPGARIAVTDKDAYEVSPLAGAEFSPAALYAGYVAEAYNADSARVVFGAGPAATSYDIVPYIKQIKERGAEFFDDPQDIDFNFTVLDAFKTGKITVEGLTEITPMQQLVVAHAARLLDNDRNLPK